MINDENDKHERKTMEKGKVKKNAWNKNLKEKTLWIAFNF